MSASPEGTPLDAFDPSKAGECKSVLQAPQHYGSKHLVTYQCTRHDGHTGLHVAASGPNWFTDFICSWARED